MRLGLKLSLTGWRKVAASVSSWILAAGAWDDTAQWDDTETWKDAP